MRLVTPTPRGTEAHPLRVLRWSHPKGHSYPFALERTLATILDAIDSPHSPMYRLLFAEAPVAGKTRERFMRRDGAGNVGTLLCALLASSDLASGYVGTPTPRDGATTKWRRKSWRDLDGLAFGALVPGERSDRRTDRAAQQLVAMGFVRVHQWRVVVDGEVRSVPGAKVICDKLWKTLGVWHLLQRERRQRRKAREAAKAAELIELAGRVTPPAASGRPAAPTAPTPAATDDRRPQGPPASSEVASAALDAIRKILER